MVNQLGGVDSLANKVNPIGASRSSLLDNPSLGVISNSNAFNWGGVLGAEAAYQFGTTSTPVYGSSAGGGFLLYPNKANTNMMQSVYSK